MEPHLSTPERLAVGGNSAMKTSSSPQITFASGDSLTLLVKSRDALKTACAKLTCGSCKSPGPALMLDGNEILCAACATDSALPLPVQLMEAIKEFRLVYSDISEHIHATQKVKIRVKKAVGASPDRPHGDGYGFQGIALNPNVTGTPSKGTSETVQRDADPPSSPAQQVVDAMWRTAQDGIYVDEAHTRDELSSTEAQDRVDLMRQQAAHYKQAKAKHRDSSKTLKSQGDRMYEEASYASAVELYTLAIRANDGTTTGAAMFGNRSAAHFMLHRWEECIEDCLAAVDSDTGAQPHTKSKLFQRAAKAASCMGHLRRAAEFLGMIHENVRGTDIEQERIRLLRGADQLDLINDASPREAIDALRMLVADFNESTPLRVRLASVYMSIGEYGRADAALDLAPLLTVETALLRAKALYMQGFERVPDALRVLEPFADSPMVQPELHRVAGMENGKQTGNNHFSNSRFGESVEQYTMALAHAEGVPNIQKILFCNRAASYKEMKKYREGMEDCTKAIEIDKRFGKAYTRRARCLLALECFSAALRDFQAALGLATSPDEARTLETEIRGVERAEKASAERDKDFYSVMELTSAATDKDIKKQYKLLSLRWHPDKCMSLSEDERDAAERKFKKIAEAYSVLSDELKRREYDLKRQRASAVPDAYRYADPTARTRFTSASNQPQQPWTRQPGKFW